jgi:septin family protein
MSQSNTVLDRAEVIRQKTLTILSSLMERARAFGLPDPAPSLAQNRQKLVNNTYQVLVVGEAKRGKSTFVNALIGRDILPTDVDIATSEVFRICPAERAAYRLRYEDDSQKEIGAADLARYGSQVVADADGAPRLDQMLRWIEVDVPARFLPANVRILDTPGLGALYARFSGSHRRA